MPATVNVQNNFIGGLKTEFTGLNFPENAATDTENCIYTLIGDVTRREGFDYEDNAVQTKYTRLNPPDNTGAAIVSYKWNNVAGDGSTQIVVLQVGLNLHFYLSSNATKEHPLSSTLIASTPLNTYRTDTGISMGTVEAQFADGNGYLFVFHPASEPFYCSYTGGTIVTTPITVLIRDFEGVNSDTAGLYSNVRPGSLVNDHQYNLYNQGWDLQKITAFNTALPGFYPSNSDVWWLFKNSSGTFDPGTTADKVIVAGPAPKGYFVIDAFDQIRNQTGVALPEITVAKRPKTGTWFAGRVWYVGADTAAVGAHTFSETLYFSQIIETSDQFGFCYQKNDPTSEQLFDLLPTDGGVIRIQGCGAVYKLFPLQNGLLVFAANGIWFITGSQGIGFAANDYTITKIDATQAISPSSFINIKGYPIFWNEEGIYEVTPSDKGGGLSVNNLTVGTIFSFFSNIPLQSKKFAKGDYHSLDFIVQWAYRSTNETATADRYQYDRILCFNVVNKAFYVYTLPVTSSYIHDIRYVAGPGGSTSPDPVFKYTVSKLDPPSGLYNFSFAEEKDNVNYRDWFSNDNAGMNYTSFFISGYRIAGKALTRWQPQYVYMFLRNQGVNAYKIQGIWDFAGQQDSNRFSAIQVVTDNRPNYNMLYRRHKIRGHGLVLQFKISSVDNKPFDIMGWSSLEQTNQGT